MCARTTRNTHWSDWVEPAAKPEPEEVKDDLLVFTKRDPAWVRDMVPMFPITSFVKDSACPHHGPIRPGSLFVCMICHQSGADDDPALKRSPLTDPKLEPKPTAAPLTTERKKDGRRKSERWAPYGRLNPIQPKDSPA